MKTELICLLGFGLLVGCSSSEGSSSKLETSELFLQPGDTIMLISPSALPSPKQVDATFNGLQEWGYVPLRSEHVCDSVRTLQDCYDDLLSALRNPAVKALFCVRGGWGSSEVMDLMPTDTIRKYPKLLIGYSDITAMHAAWQKASIPSMHASMAQTWIDLPDTCAELERKMLEGHLPTYHFAGTEWNQEGKAEGILVGGNLSILLMTMNTHYDGTLLSEPYILLLEDVGGSWQGALHDLVLLYHSGVLSRAQAIIYGEWVDMHNNESDYNGLSRGGLFTSMEDMIHRQIGDKVDVPTAYALPIGHGLENYPLMLGMQVCVDIRKDGVTLEWK